jgi:polyhydroxyalkanoate synthesis regulator phasin
MVKDKIETVLDMSVGAFLAAAEKGREVAGEFAKRGREAREKQRGRLESSGKQKTQGRASAKKAVSDELAKILSKMQIATAKDVARLEERITEIEARIERLVASPGGCSPGSAGTV